MDTVEGVGLVTDSLPDLLMPEGSCSILMGMILSEDRLLLSNAATGVGVGVGVMSSPGSATVFSLFSGNTLAWSLGFEIGSFSSTFFCGSSFSFGSSGVIVSAVCWSV